MCKSLRFDLGRDALAFIVRKYGIKELHIPYYLCDVIRHTIVKEDCKPIFYHIDDSFYPDIVFKEQAYILYPNYWGVCKNNVNKLSKKYKNLIVDNAHAYYEPHIGLASFNAGHKFGYEHSYAFFEEDKERGFLCSKQDKINRNKIFKDLHQKYGKTNSIALNLEQDDFSPFVYPYLAKTIDEANELVKEIKSNGKIVYRYWNPLPKSFNEYKFYSRLIPIPILP